MKSFNNWLCDRLNESTQILGLPPEPGTVPVPAGHVRLYHQTSDKNVNSIRENGILKSYSRGRASKDPDVIWATETPFYGPVYSDGQATVEFSLPICNKRNYPCFESPTYVAGDSVPPELIIAIHEYWHQLAKDLIEQYPVNKEEFVKSFRTIDDNYRKAVDFYFKYHGLDIDTIG